MRHFNFISYFTLHKNDKCGKDRSESNEKVVMSLNDAKFKPRIRYHYFNEANPDRYCV